MVSWDYQEAIEHIARNLLDNFSKPIVLEALEKQIPKKPRDCYMSRVNGKFNWVCDCGTYFNTDELPNYCPECGQKLDFSDGWD